RSGAFIWRLLFYVWATNHDRRQRKASEGRPHPRVAIPISVRVPVQRRRRLFVAHDPRHVIDRHAIRDQPGGVGVAEMMETECVRQASPLKRRLPCPRPERPALEWLTRPTGRRQGRSASLAMAYGHP